ncbi:putative 2OG-Fe(II) oxygenase [Actimicrobium antarcticum]|uniref:Fe2OG dioxygenase domain-containing protein n=1 Tax=Actimicrobium antarcticum TaxID=1051899 RepID=A0ABP7TJS7_9BURK
MNLAQIAAYRQTLQPRRALCDDVGLGGQHAGREQLRCWVVLMECNGHETPYLHPDGSISGVYYVCLPDVMDAADTTHAGWIEFGQPDPSFSTRSLVPTLPVRPQAGPMLLFLSYFWHRTIPFQSDQPRLSIAFDLCLSGRG